jgi:hypothetical protein
MGLLSTDASSKRRIRFFEATVRTAWARRGHDVFMLPMAGDAPVAGVISVSR